MDKLPWLRGATEMRGQQVKKGGWKGYGALRGDYRNGFTLSEITKDGVSISYSAKILFLSLSFHYQRSVFRPELHKILFILLG
jgi:hypothetical protein